MCRRGFLFLKSYCASFHGDVVAVKQENNYLCTMKKLILKNSFIEMKKLLLCACMVMTLMASNAQDSGIFSHYSLSGGIGTTGFTADFGTMVGNHIGLRGGIDYMPKINYSDELDLNHVFDVYHIDPDFLPDGIDVADMPTTVDVKGTFDSFTGHALLDVYPSGNHGFHITLGAYFAGKEKVLYARNQEEGSLMMVSDFNARRGAFALVPESYGLVTARMGKYDLMPDDNGNVNAYVTVKKIRPYAGLGFGRAVPNSGLNCQFDLGVQFWGTPKVYDGVSGQQLTDEGAQGEDHGLLKIIRRVSVYPVVSLRLCGRLF